MIDSERIERARRLMRDGFSDEAIESQTGLDPMAILEIRAKASVEAAAASMRPSPAPSGRRA